MLMIRYPNAHDKILINEQFPIMFLYTMRKLDYSWKVDRCLSQEMIEHEQTDTSASNSLEITFVTMHSQTLITSKICSTFALPLILLGPVILKGCCP